MLVLLLTSVFAGVIERVGRSSARPLLLLQLLMLAGFLVLGVTAGPWRNADAILAIAAGMCGVAAMAVQNALVQISMTNTPSTAVMTTNVTHFMVDLGAVIVSSDPAAIAKAKSRALRTLPLIVGFAVGGGLGAAGEAAIGLWSLILPTALAFLALATGIPTTRKRSND
jgi:uncharacterized membrane protein YoaK (UPF0700 family)